MAARKTAFPVEKVRRFMEPGPVVLVSSRFKDKTDIMTMGWHMVLETSPSLLGCYIWSRNFSHDLIKRSKECVINIPDAKMARTVVKIGNTSGKDIDKFAVHKLTAVPGKIVGAPLIAECHTNLECKLVDSSLIRKYSLFVFEVVRAVSRSKPALPQTIHYRGAGEFMVSGGSKSLRSLFRKDYL